MSSGSLLSSASSSPCGIENGLWLKSIFFCSSLIFEHRVIDDPAESERILLDQAELLARRGSAPGRRAWPPRLPCRRRRKCRRRDRGPSRRPARPCLRCRGSWRSGRPIRRPCGSRSRGRRSLRSRAQSFISSKNLRLLSAVPGAATARTSPPPSDDVGEQAEARAAEMLADIMDRAADCAGRACRCRISASLPCRECAETRPPA